MDQALLAHWKRNRAEGGAPTKVAAHSAPAIDQGLWEPRPRGDAAMDQALLAH
jgi:hypothetical protein